MDKDSIVKVLAKRYPSQTTASVESVAADIYYSGEPAAILAAQSVIDRLFEGFYRKQIEAQKSAVDSNEFCPICKMKTQPVKLAEGKPAKWCKSHFVVFPVKEG